MSIAAFDDTDRRHDGLTLDVEAGKVVHFNSDDLELRQCQQRTDGTHGIWRGRLAARAVERLGRRRARLCPHEAGDGFLTSMHDVVPERAGRYEVAVFNPGSNSRQVSVLRLVNDGSGNATVRVRGWDDDGGRSGHVRLTLPAGRSRNVSAQELEAGGNGLAGKLGDGKGKWRLTVTSDRPIKVMNLLSSPTGHLTNLSTSPRP